MNEDLKCCLGLAFVYAEVMFLLAYSTTIDLWSPLFNVPSFLAIPNTVAQFIGIPFMVLGLLYILGIVPTDNLIGDERYGY